MKVILIFLALLTIAPACSNQSDRSNSDSEKTSEQMNKGDMVPDDATQTPQNQNKTNKPKVLSF